jgi:hypothetical protein
VKANWDIEQQWNIYELALDAQKPKAIKKNKPKLKKGEKEAKDDDDIEYDEWGEPIDKTSGTSRNNSSSSFSGLNGLSRNGFQTTGSGRSTR